MQTNVCQLRAMAAKAKVTADHAKANAVHAKEDADHAQRLYEELRAQLMKAEAVTGGKREEQNRNGKVVIGPWAVAAIAAGEVARYLFGGLRRTAVIGSITTVAMVGGITFAVIHRPYNRPAPVIPAAVATPSSRGYASPHPASTKHHTPVIHDSPHPTTPVPDTPISTLTPTPLKKPHGNPHGTPPGHTRKPKPPSRTPEPKKKCQLGLLELVCKLLPNR